METSASLKLPLQAARAEESALAEDLREVFFGAAFFDAPFRDVLRFAIREMLFGRDWIEGTRGGLLRFRVGKGAARAISRKSNPSLKEVQMGKDDRYNPDKERPGYGISHPTYDAAHRRPFPGALFSGQKRDDESIAKEIGRKLAAVEGLDASEISVRVSCGEVTVEGVVKNEGERTLVEDVACNTPGVSDCQNNLRVA